MFEEEERRYSELRGKDRFRDMRTGEREREGYINCGRDDEARRSAGNIREEDWSRRQQ